MFKTVQVKAQIGYGANDVEVKVVLGLQMDQSQNRRLTFPHLWTYGTVTGSLTASLQGGAHAHTHTHHHTQVLKEYNKNYFKTLFLQSQSISVGGKKCKSYSCIFRNSKHLV